MCIFKSRLLLSKYKISVKARINKTSCTIQNTKNSKVKYVEKHFGSGTGTGKRILNPGTEVYLQDSKNPERKRL